MGCEVSGDLILYRSRLGNSLAEHSKAKGLAPVGMVAYVEVGLHAACVKGQRQGTLGKGGRLWVVISLR
jgi:hypothetical protein